jgi:hypothetical protein
MNRRAFLGVFSGVLTAPVVPWRQRYGWVRLTRHSGDGARYIYGTWGAVERSTYPWWRAHVPRTAATSRQFLMALRAMMGECRIR